MEKFPGIDELNELLTELADSIPSKFFKGLSGGIVLLDEAKLHPEDLAGDLYILGEYWRRGSESCIKIYYGSLKKAYSQLRENELKEKLEELLYHELTHHLEYRARLRDLEIEDEKDLMVYKASKNIPE